MHSSRSHGITPILKQRQQDQPNTSTLPGAKQRKLRPKKILITPHHHISSLSRTSTSTLISTTSSSSSSSLSSQQNQSASTTFEAPAQRRYVPPQFRQVRRFALPAGDFTPSIHGKKHPAINPDYVHNQHNNLLLPNTSQSSILIGADSSGTISSAAFGSTEITDTMIKVGDNIIRKVPSATMTNIDSELLQFIDKKSWLPARRTEDTLPAGLPSHAQQRIRDFQAKLPTPVHTDTASILALPKSLGGFEFDQLTFIQGKLLPMIASGLDILLRAPTSSGKTLAYAIPLLERLIYSRHASNSRDIPIIILVPSRELALQTTATIKHLLSLHHRVEHRRYGVLSLIGGSSAMRVEQEPLQRTDIGFLIATTQRLLDHIDHTPGFATRLQECKMVVLDEVDYLLAQTGGTDIGKVLSVLHPQRQTIMLSATLTPAVRKVASFALRKGACVVDVVKDSIVSLGTGISSTLSGAAKAFDNNGDALDANPEKLQESQSKEIGQFAADEHDLFVKRQQNLVGKFVNQKGETIHLDQNEIVDRLGKNELVYEKQAFKRLAQQEEEEFAKRQEIMDHHEEVVEFEYTTEIDSDTGIQTVKKVPKKVRQNLSNNDSSQVNTGMKLTLNDQDFLQNAGLGQTINPNETITSKKRVQAHDIQRHHENRSGFNEHNDKNANPEGNETKSTSKLHKITDHDSNSASKLVFDPTAALLKFKSSKQEGLNIEEDDFDESNSPDSLSSQSPKTEKVEKVDEHTQNQFKDILNSARKHLESANVGSVSQLLSRNESIVDDLALYSDDETDDDVVLFDEVNNNVQHYVQAASTAESMVITARLLDDIGGRYMFAKEQVRQHNDRLSYDVSYQGVELVPPKPPKVMIFCETARFAQYFSALMRNTIDTDTNSAYEAILELHGKKGQNYRTRVTQQFSSSNWNAGCILISSDVAARGLDTKDVDCVIQIGLPPSRQQWVHRIGRVARDGDQQGVSLTLVCPEHANLFSRMTSGLPIAVPKVGTLGLGVRQDKFNNSEVDPIQNTFISYKPAIPSSFGEVGEYFDDEVGEVSGQLRTVLLAKEQKRKKLEASETKLLHSVAKQLSLDHNINTIDQNDDPNEEYGTNSTTVPFQSKKLTKHDRRNEDFDPINSQENDNTFQLDAQDSRDDIYDDTTFSEVETTEQPLWHGTIERAVSTVYLNRIKDDTDRQQRVDQLNHMTMSANTGDVAGKELYARYDYIMKKQLTRNILRNEEMRLHAERAYIAYLGHHIAVYNRSRGIEERLKSVKLSKSPFKNKDQICKLAYDFAKAVGLCGPNGDLLPPAISLHSAQRLGLSAANTKDGLLNIGVPTQFTHIVELHRIEEEKQKIELQREDHRVRRRYWEQKQVAIQAGKPIPQPPKELILQRQRYKTLREATAITRATDSISKQKKKILEKYGVFDQVDQTTDIPSAFEPSTATHTPGSNSLEPPSQDISSPSPSPKPSTHQQSTTSLRDTKVRTTNLVAFSDDETDPILPQTIRRVARSQAMNELNRHNGDRYPVENISVSGEKFNQKVTKYFPTTQQNQRTQQQAEEQAKTGNTKPQPQHWQYKNEASQFFEEHQEWAKQQEYRKMRKERDIMANEEASKKEREAQDKYKKAFKKREERDKKEPAPGRDLLSQSAMYQKEPRRIRTGELDHKVHLDIVL